MIVTKSNGRRWLIAPAKSLTSRAALAFGASLLIVEHCRVGNDTSSFYRIAIR